MLSCLLLLFVSSRYANGTQTHIQTYVGGPFVYMLLSLVNE